MNLDIPGPEYSLDILIKPLLWQAVLRNAIPEHASKLLMLLIKLHLMSHKRKVICCRKT